MAADVLEGVFGFGETFHEGSNAGRSPETFGGNASSEGSLIMPPSASFGFGSQLARGVHFGEQFLKAGSDEAMSQPFF